MCAPLVVGQALWHACCKRLRACIVGTRKSILRTPGCLDRSMMCFCFLRSTMATLPAALAVARICCALGLGFQARQDIGRGAAPAAPPWVGNMITTWLGSWPGKDFCPAQATGAAWPEIPCFKQSVDPNYRPVKKDLPASELSLTVASPFGLQSWVMD